MGVEDAPKQDAEIIRLHMLDRNTDVNHVSYFNVKVVAEFHSSPYY